LGGTNAIGDKRFDSPFVTIARPPLHEGVGQALRAAYAPSASDIIPGDMADLLSRLDAIKH